jgi:hypothetical protein
VPVTVGCRGFDPLVHSQAANISLPRDPLGVIPKYNFGPGGIRCATIRNPEASETLNRSGIQVHGLTVIKYTRSQISSSHAVQLFEAEVGLNQRPGKLWPGVAKGENQRQIIRRWLTLGQWQCESAK